MFDIFYQKPYNALIRSFSKIGGKMSFFKIDSHRPGKPTLIQVDGKRAAGCINFFKAKDLEKMQKLITIRQAAETETNDNCRTSLASLIQGQEYSFAIYRRSDDETDYAVAFTGKVLMSVHTFPDATNLHLVIELAENIFAYCSIWSGDMVEVKIIKPNPAP